MTRPAPHLRLVEATEPPPVTDPEAAFARYGRYVGAVAMRLLGRDEEVDDVVQEVFIELVRAVDRGRTPERMKGWLATVTTRVVARRLKRRRVRSLLWVDEEPDYETVAGGDASPEVRALLGQLYRELDRLPVDLRVAWTLRHVEGEALDRVAAMTGTSLATAKRRIRAAHERLQRRLGDSAPLRTGGRHG